MNAGPEGLQVLAPEGPDDFGDHEADGDERLHRPEVGRPGLLAACDECGVVADDGEGCRRDRADGTGPQGGHADREGIQDPRAELERKREHQARDRGHVEYRHTEWDPLK